MLSGLGVLGCRRELSPPFLRPPLRRDEAGCGVLFSSGASAGWLFLVRVVLSRGDIRTNSAEDMAALPLPFAFLERAGASWGSVLVRLARPPRGDGSSGLLDDCSRLASRGAVFLLRVEAGGRWAGAVGGGGGGLGAVSLLDPVDRLAAERVTLDEDMRFWF